MLDCGRALYKFSYAHGIKCIVPPRLYMFSPCSRWVFLEVLGSLTLFGVMLIDAESRRFVLAMSELTMFSTSMLCFVMADYDSPFNGFFRVDLSILPDVVTRIEDLYAKEATGGREGEKLSEGVLCRMKDSTSIHVD